MDNFPFYDDSNRLSPAHRQDQTSYYKSEDETVDTSRQRLVRRRFLRRSLLSVWGLSATASVAGALALMYPHLTGQFGDLLDLGDKRAFPAATPDQVKLDQMGVFHLASARLFIVHLDQETRFLRTGSSLVSQLKEEQFLRDTDGSYWLALYQSCVHLGTTVAFLNNCGNFKCPSHGAQYLCDGEYLNGPAPRSMDRFPLSFQNQHLLVNTGLFIYVPRPDDTSRLLPPPLTQCV